MKFLLFIVLWVLAPLSVLAQNRLTGSRNFYLRAAPYTGIILEHSPKLGHLVTGYVKGFHLDFIKPTYGNQLWQHENNMPELGLSFNYIDFGNPRELGYCYALAPFVEIPLNEKTRASRVIMRLGWGLAYATKDFDVETNHKNIAIGSHWNGFVQFKWLWALQLSERLRIEPGFMLSHVSNGRSQVPNLGLNIAALNLGLTYKFLREPAIRQPCQDSSSAWNSRHELLVLGMVGFTETDPPGGPKYMAYGLSIHYFYNKRNTHKFGFGMDLGYETENLNYIDDSNEQKSIWKDQFIFGPKLCYAYNVGRLSFPLEMGVYAYNRVQHDGPLFHRIGVRYFSRNGLVFNFSLKSHWAIASHFEYGLGYRFGLKHKPQPHEN